MVICSRNKHIVCANYVTSVSLLCKLRKEGWKSFNKILKRENTGSTLKFSEQWSHGSRPPPVPSYMLFLHCIQAKFSFSFLSYDIGKLPLLTIILHIFLPFFILLGTANKNLFE